MSYKRFISIVWLPVVLSIVLVAETLLFNRWLGIAGIEGEVYLWRTVAAAAGVSALLFFPSVFIANRHARYAYLFILSLPVAVLFTAQYLYYEYSGGFLEASALGYSDQATALTSTIATLLTYRLFLFIVPLALIALGYFFAPRTVHARLSKKEKLVAGAVLLVIFCSGYGGLLLSEKKEFGDVSRLYKNDAMYNLTSLVAKIGILNFSVESALAYIVQPHTASAADKAFLAAWAATRTPAVKGADFGSLKGRNVIFLQIESLENFVIGYKVNGVLVAPNLTAMAAAGAYFPNYYSQDGEGNTADAEFSTQNSLYPLPDSVVFITHAQNQFDALPHLLDGNGYTTAVMHGDVSSFWNRSNVYPAFGYEKIFDRANYTVPRVVGPEVLGDDDFFAQSLPKLQSLPQPFMTTLITLSSHTPFTLPADLETLTFPADTTLTPTQQQYLQAVHYTDMSIGHFLAGLKADGLYNNSLIVLYGDHNAFIGTPDSQIQHVPLIVLAPGSGLQGTYQTPGSHLDVYPTVASLLGIQPPTTVFGQDLFSTPTPVVTQRVPATGAMKFIISKNVKYTAASSDVFADGTCTTFPKGTPLPVSSCRQLFDQQTAATHASDIVVRYNLLSLLASISPK